MTRTRIKSPSSRTGRANALIVGAPPEEMATVESLVKRLDVLPADDKTNLGIFPLAKGNATQVAKTLQDLFKNQDQKQTEITIGVDERLNAVVVSAGKADLERIEKIIRQLDRSQVTHVTEIKVYPLKNADSEELAKLMMDVLTQKPKTLTTTNPNRQTLLQFINRSRQGRELITSALQEGILITPDRRTNSLVVTASLENMPLLANLIESLDSSTPTIGGDKGFRITKRRRDTDGKRTGPAVPIERGHRFKPQSPGRQIHSELQKKLTARPRRKPLQQLPARHSNLC